MALELAYLARTPHLAAYELQYFVNLILYNDYQTLSEYSDCKKFFSRHLGFSDLEAAHRQTFYLFPIFFLFCDILHSF